MMMPKPVSPPPVMAPNSLCVKPNCLPQSPRMPPRMANPTPAARMAMKPAKSRRFALGAVAFCPFPFAIRLFRSVRLRLTAEVRQFNDFPPAHGRFMRANPRAGPVDRLIHVRERRAALHDAHDELVRQMRMRAAVAAALD